MFQNYIQSWWDQFTISKVQQRGINATKEVLLQLVEGMNEGDNHKLLVVDLHPSRFFVQTCPNYSK